MRCTVPAVFLAVACNAGDIPAFDASDPPPLRTVATASDGLATPRDLQFDPANPTDVWVVNRETDAVVILFDAGTDKQQADERADSFGNHFMEEVSALAFGQPGTFATAQESNNTFDDHQAPNGFMGPALWPTDLDVFAVVNQNGPLLGSHLDMLHGSPFAMGIAWEAGNVYWVADGRNDEIVRYDFQQDHGPGYDDHADGVVRRYHDIVFERVADVPSHMEFDLETGLLYLAHTATGAVVVIDPSTAAFDYDLPPHNEPLEESSVWLGATVTELVTGLDQPSGLALDGDVLYVGEHGTGDIVALSLKGGTELGRIATGRDGLMGLAVDADHRLWFADGAASEVVLIDR